LYIYVKNNPLKYVDPSGETPDPRRQELIAQAKRFIQGATGYGIGISQGLEDTSNIFWHPIQAAKGLINYIKEGANAWKETASSLYNNFSQTLSETGRGMAISYNESMDMSPYEQGKAIGYMTEKVGEGVIMGKVANKAITGPSLKNQPISNLFENRTPTASELIKYGKEQGWTIKKTSTGPIQFIDENGVTRLKIKQGSPRTPGSENPHVEIKNSQNQRIDPFGNRVILHSQGNHASINWDL